MVDRGGPLKGLVRTVRDVRRDPLELRKSVNFSYPDGRPVRRQGFGFWNGNETRINNQQLTKQTPVVELPFRTFEDVALQEFSLYEKHPNSYGLIRWHDDFQPKTTRDWTVEFLLTLGEKERLVINPEDRQTRSMYGGVLRAPVRNIYGVFVYDQTVIASFCDFDFDAGTRNLRPPTQAGYPTAANITHTDTLAISALAIAYWKDKIWATCTLINTGVYFPYKVQLEYSIATYTPGDVYHVAVRFTNSTDLLELVVNGSVADSYTLLADERFAGEQEALNDHTTPILRDIVILNECTVRGAYSSTCKLAHRANGCSRFTQHKTLKFPPFIVPPAVVMFSSPPRGTGMAELRIWHEARSDGNLSAEAKKELATPYSSNLKGYWRLNDGSGLLVEKVAERHGSVHNTFPQYVADKNLLHKQGLKFTDNQFLTTSLPESPYLFDAYEYVRSVMKGHFADTDFASTKLEAETDFTVQIQVTLPYTAQQELNFYGNGAAYPHSNVWNTGEARETPGDGTAPPGTDHFLHKYELKDGAATPVSLATDTGAIASGGVDISMFHPAYDQTLWSIEGQEKVGPDDTDNHADLRRIPLARGMLDPTLRPIFEFFCDGTLNPGRRGRYLRLRGSVLTAGATKTLTFRKRTLFEKISGDAQLVPTGYRLEIWVDGTLDVFYNQITVAGFSEAATDLLAFSRAIEHAPSYDINIGASYVNDYFDRAETAPIDNTEFTFPVRHGMHRNTCYQDQPGFFTMGFFRFWAVAIKDSEIQNTWNASLPKIHAADQELIINLEIDQVTGRQVLNKTRFPLTFELGFKGWHVANADSGFTAQKWIFEEFQWGNQDCLGFNRLLDFVPAGSAEVPCNLLGIYEATISRTFGLMAIFRDSPLFDDSLSGVLVNLYLPVYGLLNEFVAGQQWTSSVIGDRMVLTAPVALPKVFDGKTILPLGFPRYYGPHPELEALTSGGSMDADKFYGVRIVYFSEDSNIEDVSPLAIVKTELTWHLSAVTIAGGGAGYTVGDILNVSGGTGTPATLQVTSVVGGTIDGVIVLTPGLYTVQPASPAGVTGGTGAGATFNLTFILNALNAIRIKKTQAHPDPRVSSFRVYRTQGQSTLEEARVAVLFLLPVGAFENEYSLDFNIMEPDADLLPNVLDLQVTRPPAGSVSAVVDDALWVAGDPLIPDNVYISDPGNPQRFDTLTNTLTIQESNGELINTILSLFGSAYIFKASSVHRADPIADGRWNVLRLAGVGPVSRRALVTAVIPDSGQTVLIFWSRFGPYIFDGQQETYIGFPIEIDRAGGEPFDWLDQGSVFILHDPIKREVIFFYRSVVNGAVAGRHDKAIVFNYRLQVWYEYQGIIGSYALSSGIANSDTIARIVAGSPTVSPVPLTPTESHRLVVGGPNGHVYSWGSDARDGERTEVSTNPGTVSSWSSPTITLTGAIFSASDVVRGNWITVFRPSDGSSFSLPALTNTSTTVTLDLSYGAVGFAPASGDLVYVGQPDAELEFPWDELGRAGFDKSVNKLLFWYDGDFLFRSAKDWDLASFTAWRSLPDNQGKRRIKHDTEGLCEVYKIALKSTALGARLDQASYMIDDKLTANKLQ